MLPVFATRLLITVAVVFLCTLSVLAQSDELLNRLQAQGYVSDYAGVFSVPQRDGLNRLLAELEQKTNAQIAVVTLSSLEGGEIRDFSNRLFERWGIGQKGLDNGVLLLTAMGDHEVWIEVGYGVEPIIPDARAGRILDEVVIPAFRQGDFAGGLTAGAQTLASIVATDSGVQLTGAVHVPQRQPGGGRGLSVFHIIIGLIGLLIFIKNPWLALFLLSSRRAGRGGYGGGGFGGSGGFGGFGGGLSGGGGAGRSW